MARWKHRTIFLLLLMVAVCGPARAQGSKNIIVRILDSKTGRPLVATGFMVRIDHQSVVHGDWVKQNEDGSAVLTVPDFASSVSIKASYENSMEVYINCDAEKQRDVPGDLWYAVSDIISKGIVAPNGCGKPKDVAKMAVPVAEPGKIVLFVRQKSWREQSMD